MSEEWGPWIEHDGKGCPVVGMWIQAKIRNLYGGVANGTLRGDHWEGRATGIDGWDWRRSYGFEEVIRYRIRQFKAMKDLKRLVEEPEKVPA